MKKFGIVLMWASVAALALAIGMLMPGGAPDEAAGLADAEHQLDLCRTYATDCSASERVVEQRRAVLNASQPDPLLSYAMAGSAPFFFLIGVILYAAGKVEEVVRTGSAATAKAEASLPPDPQSGSLRMTPEEAAAWTKKHKT